MPVCQALFKEKYYVHLSNCFSSVNLACSKNRGCVIGLLARHAAHVNILLDFFVLKESARIIFQEVIE